MLLYLDLHIITHQDSVVSMIMKQHTDITPVCDISIPPTSREYKITGLASSMHNLHNMVISRQNIISH